MSLPKINADIEKQLKEWQKLSAELDEMIVKTDHFLRLLHGELN